MATELFDHSTKLWDFVFADLLVSPGHTRQLKGLPSKFLFHMADHSTFQKLLSQSAWFLTIIRFNDDFSRVDCLTEVLQQLILMAAWNKSPVKRLPCNGKEKTIDSARLHLKWKPRLHCRMLIIKNWEFRVHLNSPLNEVHMSTEYPVPSNLIGNWGLYSHARKCLKDVKVTHHFWYDSNSNCLKFPFQIEFEHKYWRRK